ncbi:MAG: oligosaccharide flippase family protein [Candidatus Methanoperedens sp.]
MIYNFLKKYLGNSLLKNSLFLLMGSYFNVASGFFFWIIAARFYSIEDVGVATALMSSLGLVMLFSRFGFDHSIIRYLPINNKNKVFNSCLIITTISTILVGFIYILSVNYFSSSLSFMQDFKFVIIFLLFAVMNSITSIIGNAFVAMRSGGLFFFQNVLQGVRVPLLIPLVFFGSFGIFGSVGISYLITTLFSFLIIKKQIGLNFKIDKAFIKESLSYSSGNYISHVLMVSPTLILPILILNLSGETETAKYYIAYAIGNLVLIIPDSLGTSLFVEGSHGESMRKNIKKSLIAIYSFLIPSVIFLYFFGDILLGFFGKNYMESFELLRYIALSSFFVVAYSLFVPIQKVRMNIASIVKLNLLRFLLLLGLSYVFISIFGIVGAGYAWMLTHVVLGILIYLLVKNNEWI